MVESASSGDTTGSDVSSDPNGGVGELLETVPAILRKISFCESGNRQFEKDGSILVSKLGTNDIGLFQINEVHFPKAKELGIDLHTIEGNTKFALMLYRESGTTPWNQSKHCWSK